MEMSVTLVAAAPKGLFEKDFKFMTAKLFVGNLAPETTSTQLQELFSTAGEVESCRVIMDRTTGLSKGFAFVEMESVAAANTATEKFNGQNLQGKTMKVNEAKPRD